MDVIDFDPRCRTCGGTLAWSRASSCLLCGGLFCLDHLIARKGIATCAACADVRRAREGASPISERDENHLIDLIARDLVGTVGGSVESMAIESAAHLRLLCDTEAEYLQRVVDDVQQRLHDEFIDTSWPECPLHGGHPLWFSDGWWRCGATAVARLGELRS